MEGLFIPPRDGMYKFLISGDKSASLLMNLDNNN